MEEFRKLVRLLIQEISLKEKQKLLAEPDVPEGEEEEEVSAGGVVGVSTPLGTGPTYPAKRRKKKSS
mgnify:CR=1 FL=1